MFHYVNMEQKAIIDNKCVLGVVGTFQQVSFKQTKCSLLKLELIFQFNSKILLSLETTSYTKCVIVTFRLLYDDCGCAETVGKGGFSKDICRSMIAMLDADHSGKLGFDEFKILWTDIRHWKVIKLVFQLSSLLTFKLSFFRAVL